MKDLQSLIFHFVSSLDTIPRQGVQAEVLVASSARSGRQGGFLMIDPFRRYTQADLAESNLPMAVAVAGSFKSYFAEREPRAEPQQSPPTRIIVVGDGDFMKDEYLGNQGNLTFFANIVDYLADDAGLITIRSKNVAVPPLEPVDDATRQLLKYGNLLVPPLLVIGYGVFRWRRRVARKKALEARGKEAMA